MVCLSDGLHLEMYKNMEFVPSESPGILNMEWPENIITGAPNFIGIGACRCGTTFWWNVITQHPSIYVPIEFVNLLQRKNFLWVKERHWFDRFALQDVNYKILRQAYASIFPRERGMITGEWTPHYLEQWWTPQLIARVAPEAKILILLRDPIERYISEITYLRGNPSQSFSSFQRGLYAKQLEQFFGWMPKDRFLIMQFEQTLIEPLETARQIFRFLELDPTFIPSFDVVRNQTKVPKIKIWHSKILFDMYIQDVNRLAKLLGSKFDLGLWENFR